MTGNLDNRKMDAMVNLLSFRLCMQNTTENILKESHKFYKVMTIPTLLYRSESWVVKKYDLNKILRYVTVVSIVRPVL